MLDVAAVVARSKCWTTTTVTPTTTRPAATDRRAAARLLLWYPFPPPHHPSRSNRGAGSNKSSSNIKRSSVGAVVVDKEAAPASTATPKAMMDDYRAEILTTSPISLTTEGGGAAPSSSAETIVSSSGHDDSSSYQGRYCPTPRPREGTSASASRDRSQSQSSSTTTFWESAEGGNSHELNVDDELELVDEARRRVASLFPSTSLPMKAAAGIVSSPSGSQDGDDDEEEDLIAAAAATMGVQQQVVAHQVQDGVVVVPQFDFKELSLGKFLGRGGFSNVHEIRRICLKSENEDNDTADDSAAAARQFLALHCTRPSGEARYAIKQVRVDAVEDSSKASKDEKADTCPQQQIVMNERRRRSLVGMMDLATEAEFLRRLEHPHVVKLRGTANCDALSPQYFLIVDRLCETLHSRLQSWKDQRRQLRRSSGLSMSSVNRLMSSLVRRCSMGSDASGAGSSRHGGNGDSTLAAVVDPHQRLWRTRLSAACDLVSAIEYLHENRIIHRDIKPTNIGFDIRGDLKIFDFGMARILDPRDADADGTYPNLSHMTGSLRYMAPEVALGLPYHTSCDVYSLSLVIWEMLSLQRPYQAITSSKRRGRRSSNAAVEDEMSHFRHKVFEGKVRPVVPSKWPIQIQQAVTGGWAHDVKDRLNVHQLSAKLVSELVLLTHPTTNTDSGHRQQQHDDIRNSNAVDNGTECGSLNPRSVDRPHPTAHFPRDCDSVLPDRRRRRSTYVFRPTAPATAATTTTTTTTTSASPAPFGHTPT